MGWCLELWVKFRSAPWREISFLFLSECGKINIYIYYVKCICFWLDQAFVRLWGVALGVLKEKDCGNEENIDSTWKDFNQLPLHLRGTVLGCIAKLCTIHRLLPASWLTARVPLSRKICRNCPSQGISLSTFLWQSQVTVSSHMLPP